MAGRLLTALVLMGGLFAVYSAVQGQWVRAAFLYLGSGIVRAIHDRCRPLVFRPWYMIEASAKGHWHLLVFFVILWPWRALDALWIWSFTSRIMGRYCVEWGTHGQDQMFRTWKQAVKFAQQKAMETQSQNHEVYILDLRRFRYLRDAFGYRKLAGSWECKTYYVEPSGRVKEVKTI